MVQHGFNIPLGDLRAKGYEYDVMDIIIIVCWKMHANFVGKTVTGTEKWMTIIAHGVTIVILLANLITYWNE